MELDLEREIHYLHARITISANGNHIALMVIQKMLEISTKAIDLGPDRELASYRGLSNSMMDHLVASNDQIRRMNAEFIDVIEAAEKRDPMYGEENGP